MDLRFSGKLTKAEFLASYKLNSRRILEKSGFHLDFWIIFTLIGVFLLLLGVVSVFQWRSFPWILVEFIGATIAIGLAWKLHKFPSEFWDENKESISSADGRISDENIEIFTPHGNLKVNWSELNGYGEYKEVIVLYKTPMFSLPFVERFFEKQEDWISFKKFVVDKLPLTHRVTQLSITAPRNKLVYILVVVSILFMLFYLYFLKGG